MSWCCLTSGDEHSAIKTLGYARNDDAREALSKLRGASDFYAPHQGLTLKFERRDEWLGIRDWGLGVTSDW